MRKFPAGWVVAAAGLILAGCLRQQAGTEPAAPQGAVSKEAALQRATDYLLSTKQHDNWETLTDWPEAGRQYGGETGLVVYALLKTGHANHDPRLKPDSAQLGPAVAWVIHAQTDTVYATALKVLVLCNATGTPDRAKVLANTTGLLIRALGKDGGYSYSLAPVSKQPLSDSSNSDYGLLAVAQASRHGVQVPQEYWAQAEHFWRTRQNADGGWGYAPPELRPQSHPAMTGGAVASLMELAARGASLESAIATGSTNLTNTFNANSGDYYYLYNLQRVVAHGGLKVSKPADVDVAGTMTEALLRTQERAGSWKTERVSFWGKPNQTISTAYALLALAGE